MARCTERHRLAGVEIRRDEKQLGLELAEIVGAPGGGEQAAQEVADRPVVEHPRRNGARQRRERRHQPVPERVAQILQRRPRDEPRERKRAQGELRERRAKKNLGRERGVGAVVDEEPVHLRGRNAVRQRCGDVAPRRHADIDVEIREVDAVERVGQREQRADFVDSAQRPAARQGEAYARTHTVLPPGATCAPGCNRYRHGTPPCDRSPPKRPQGENRPPSGERSGEKSLAQGRPARGAAILPRHARFVARRAVRFAFAVFAGRAFTTFFVRFARVAGAAAGARNVGNSILGSDFGSACCA